MRILLFLFFLSAQITNHGFAEPIQSVDIYSKGSKKIPILIQTQKTEVDRIGISLINQIATIINLDLSSIGAFYSVYKGEEDPNSEPRSTICDSARSSGFENIAELRITKSTNQPDGYIVSVTLIDAFSEDIMLEKKYSVITSAGRKAGHIIADTICFHLTGKDGSFQSKIIYVDEIGFKKDKRRLVAVIDRDGENHRYLSSTGLSMTPFFSKNRKSIIYSSFSGGVARIKEIDIFTGKATDLSSIYSELQEKEIMSPEISMDGSFIIFTMLSAGSADIHRLDLSSGGQLKKLTDRGINVGPSISPDGNHIVFTSNQSGKPSLHIMSSNGWNPSKISKANGHYFEPSWSPDGEAIAFTKLLGNVFYIGTMKPDGSNERILTSGYLAEGPSWSPNGNQIAFTFKGKKDSKPAIKIIDIKGKTLKIINTPGKPSDINWVQVD